MRYVSYNCLAFVAVHHNFQFMMTPLWFALSSEEMNYVFNVIKSDIRDIASGIIIYNNICQQGLATFLT